MHTLETLKAHYPDNTALIGGLKRRSDGIYRNWLAGTDWERVNGATRYQTNGRECVAVPTWAGAWDFSETFRRWGRYAAFADGWHGYTFPVVEAVAT